MIHMYMPASLRDGCVSRGSTVLVPAAPSLLVSGQPISTDYSISRLTSMTTYGITTPGVDVIVDDGRKAVRFKLLTTHWAIKV